MGLKPGAVSEDLQRITKAKIEAARYELQLYQEQLEATRKEIKGLEERAGTKTTAGIIPVEPYKQLLTKRDNLEEKVIQAKVKVREIELLAGEKP